MIQVTLSVTAAQLAQIAAIMDGQATENVKPAARKTAADKPKTEPEPEQAAEPEVKGKSAAGDDVAELPSADHVTAAAKGYAARNGRDALVALLEKHGAKNVSGLAEDKRQAFIDEASA